MKRVTYLSPDADYVPMSITNVLMASETATLEEGNLSEGSWE